MKETDIQLAICEYLHYKGYFFWRQNNVSVYDAKSGRYRGFPKYCKRGIPDIILIKKGTFYGLEVKRPNGMQSGTQIEFEELCAKAGGIYKIVTSVDDVIAMGL